MLLAETITIDVDWATQVLSTTGPIGTLLVWGMIQARRRLAEIHNHMSAIDAFGVRLDRIEAHLGLTERG